MHARKALRVAIAIGALAAITIVGCLSFGELSGGNDDASDAALPEASTDSNVVSIFDAGTLDGAPITFQTCAAAHAAFPDAPDGVFPLTSLDAGPPVPAFCDMTRDDGGWMLVTKDMIETQTFPGGTAINTADVLGGLIVENYPDDNPCGMDAGPIPRDLIVFNADRQWAQIRVQYSFNGLVSCFSVFGATDLGVTKNTIPFDKSIDLERDDVKMGGVDEAGKPSDEFDGVLHHCDYFLDNFWQFNATSERSVTIALRRDLPGSAGLTTQANCFTGPTGTSATSWWEYRDIYVR